MRKILSILFILMTLIGCNKSNKGSESSCRNNSSVLETPGTSVYDDTAHVNLYTLVGFFVEKQKDILIWERQLGESCFD